MNAIPGTAERNRFEVGEGGGGGGLKKYDFYVGVHISEHRRREPLEGSGGMLPRPEKFEMQNAETLKCYFQHSPRDISSKTKSESSIKSHVCSVLTFDIPETFKLMKARRV